MALSDVRRVLCRRTVHIEPPTPSPKPETQRERRTTNDEGLASHDLWDSGTNSQMGANNRMRTIGLERR